MLFVRAYTKEKKNEKKHIYNETTCINCFDGSTGFRFYLYPHRYPDTSLEYDAAFGKCHGNSCWPLFGPISGGLAAGLGSAIYDMLDPRYLPTCWLTFLMKFAMGWVAGKLAEKNTDQVIWKNVFAGSCGSLTYVVLYVLKTFIQNRVIYGYEMEAVMATVVTKGITSLVNGIIAVVVATILNRAIRPSLKKAGILD